MFKAISFGVFCLFAPSTSAIIRSKKLSPGFWVIRTTMRSEDLGTPGYRGSVPTGLTNYRCRLSGDHRFINCCNPLNDISIARNHLSGLDDDHIAKL
jgi:hypothetical protein